MKGIDCVTRIKPAVAAELMQAGYRFVCRYLVPAGYSKRLTAAEAKVISDAGMDILCVYETTAGRARGGAANGLIDGAAAYKEAVAFNMPASGYIYFAVDVDVAAADMDNIAAYLLAARKQTGPYEIGVYGEYAVIEEMARRGACRGFWQTYAWSGGKVSAHNNVYQYRNGQTAAGISVDFNEANNTVGMWNYRANDSSIKEHKEIIRARLIAAGVTGIDAVWNLNDAHPYPEEWYRKWAESYK